MESLISRDMGSRRVVWGKFARGPPGWPYGSSKRKLISCVQQSPSSHLLAPQEVRRLGLLAGILAKDLQVKGARRLLLRRVRAYHKPKLAAVSSKAMAIRAPREKLWPIGGLSVSILERVQRLGADA